MGVTFVLGRPSGRREDVIVNRIKEIAGADPLAPVLVIVPPQATYATECMLLDRLNAEGMMGVNVASISRIAQRVLEEVYGGAQKTLNAAGKSMLIKKILTEHAAEFPVFGRMRARDFLPPRLAETITEMKQLDITPAMLRDFKAGSPDTAEKFRDISMLYEKLEEEMAGAQDTEDRLNTVIGHIHEADFIRGACVFIHGFDMYNSQTVRFITEMMKAAKHTVISFLYADGPDGGVYEICRENRERFTEQAKALGLETIKVTEETQKSPDMLYIEKNLYAYPAAKAGAAKDVSVSYAKDTREEVDGVAAQIAFLTQKRSYRFDEIAVLCGDAEHTLPVIRDRFRRAGIPCYTGEKRGLLRSNLSDFVLTAFELCRGRLRKDTLLEHAASGFTNLTGAQRYALENYSYANIRDGFAFARPFNGKEGERYARGGAPVEEAEQARKALMGPIEVLRKNAAKAKGVRKLAESVSAYMESLDIRTKMEEQCMHMRGAGLYESAAFLEQAYGKMTNILAQAADILDGEQSGAGMARALRAGLAAEQISVIPPASNEVLCGDLSGTWLPHIRALFVLGMNEGVVPSYAPGTDILTEAERELILGGIKGLKHTGSLDKQKLAIVKALGRPREKLFLSCVRDGQAQPSPVLDRLFALFGSIKENKMEDAPLLAQNAYEKTVKRLRMAADGAEVEKDMPMMAAVLDDPAYEKGVIIAEKNISGENRAERIGKFAKDLYGDFSSSATRIEQYYGCPYRHFMTYGVRAMEPREYGIDGLDVGLYAHSVLDRLSKKIKGGGKSWKDLPEGDFIRILDESVAEARQDDVRYGLNRHNENVIKAVTKEIAAVAGAIRAQCEKGTMQPYESEYRFFLSEVNIGGVIDRIDIGDADGVPYFGIVDYKTGCKDFELARVVGGTDLQLMLYILAAYVLLGEEYAFGGANYMRVQSALREREKALEPLYRMRGVEGAAADAARQLYGQGEGGSLFSVGMRVKADGEYYGQDGERFLPPNELDAVLAYCTKLVKEARENIFAGNTAISPAVYKTEQACAWCPYSAVCMFDKESGAGARAIEKLNKQEALERMKSK